MFSSVLIANRGEIAVRVTRTLRRLGVRAVAVHTDADARAPHVVGPDAADVAVRVPDYLDAAAIVAAARATGARAVHPGYGFLAENAAFARACADAGLVFVGPPPDAIDSMGDKIRAKATVGAAGVPLVPGSHDAGMSDDALAAAATDTGFPVLLKPSAGGGGKGMHVVRDPAGLVDTIATARREARGSFGDDTLLVERYVDSPRHVEIQVLADAHGGVVHLGERECSLQRRHQKIVEEAPSSILDEKQRAEMGAAAVEAARACGYVGAGTVEFVTTPDAGEYFFLEMNTRLQVEHPVTEMVVRVRGREIDLVAEQLRVAAGETLGYDQDDVTLDGHAVEVRVYAEDPARGFLPTGGRVLDLHWPPHARVDAGVAVGTEVGSAYDPMLAKVIAHGPDRAAALDRLDAALARTAVLGLGTNVAYLRRLLAAPDVRAGRLDTGLVERLPADDGPGVPDDVVVAAALVGLLRLPETDDPFGRLGGWRLGGPPAPARWRLAPVGGSPADAVDVAVAGRADDARVTISAPASGGDAGATTGSATTGSATTGSATTDTAPDGTAPDGTAPDGTAPDGTAPDGTAGDVTPAPRHAAARHEGADLVVTLDGVTRRYRTAVDGAVLWLARDGSTWALREQERLTAARTASAAADGPLLAPMPGTVTVVDVAEGDVVVAGQRLLVVEAMKMEHVIAAPTDGVVRELTARAGRPVALDAPLVTVVPDDPGAQRSTEEPS